MMIPLPLYAYMPYIVTIVYIHTYTLPQHSLYIQHIYIHMIICIIIIYAYVILLSDYPHACTVVILFFVCNVLHEYIKYYLYGIYIFVYHCIAFLHIAFFPDSSRFLLAFLLPLVEKTSTGASQNPSKHCYMSGSQIDSVAAGTAPTKAKQTLPRAEGLR